MYFKPDRTPGNPQTRTEMVAPGPQISSDCLRKSLDFEIGVGGRLGAFRLSRSKRLFLLYNPSQRATTDLSAEGKWFVHAVKKDSPSMPSSGGP